MLSLILKWFAMGQALKQASKSSQM